MKCSRIGYTKLINHVIGFHIEHDPCSLLVVQPTVEDGAGYSKEEIAPMLRDTPCLDKLVSDPRSRDSSNTIMTKAYPGGVLHVVGANSPRGFRRITVRKVLFDEVDGYPASAGTEGDQIKLGEKRAEDAWNRQFIIGSTPTIKGFSKVERSFESSDKRFYHVPCPHCKKKQKLEFKNLIWPKGEPKKAHFVCTHCNKDIDESKKYWMLEHGEWIAEKPFDGHAGFHIWAAYSLQPNASWGQIATDFLEAKDDPLTLQVFVNTSLAETFEQASIDVDEDSLYARRENYEKLPDKNLVITCGVDVQADRLELEAKGWGIGEESHGVEYKIIYGDTTQIEVWNDLEDYLDQTYETEDGRLLHIACTMVDSGYNTDYVYDFVLRKSLRRVYATKGVGGEGRPIIGKPTKQRKKNVKLYPIGVDQAKTVIYTRLAKEKVGNGYYHFPLEYDKEFFEQLTAEKLVTKFERGVSRRVWLKKRPRNEALDINVLNYAALKLLDPNWKALIKNIHVKEEKEVARKKAATKKTPDPALVRHKRKLKRKPKKGFAKSW